MEIHPQSSSVAWGAGFLPLFLMEIISMEMSYLVCAEDLGLSRFIYSFKEVLKHTILIMAKESTIIVVLFTVQGPMLITNKCAVMKVRSC